MQPDQSKPVLSTLQPSNYEEEGGTQSNPIEPVKEKKQATLEHQKVIF